MAAPSVVAPAADNVLLERLAGVCCGCDCGCCLLVSTGVCLPPMSDDNMPMRRSRRCDMRGIVGRDDDEDDDAPPEAPTPPRLLEEPATEEEEEEEGASEVDAAVSALPLPCSPPAPAEVVAAAAVDSVCCPSEAELAPAADGGAADGEAGAACGGCCIGGSDGGCPACASFVIMPCAGVAAVPFLKKRSRKARPLPLPPPPRRGCVAEGRVMPPLFLLFVLIFVQRGFLVLRVCSRAPAACRRGCCCDCPLSAQLEHVRTQHAQR
jgi:hypothetical protein